MTRRLWSDWGLLAWNGFLVIASPWFLGDKLRRYLKRRNFHEIDPDRWNIPVDFAGLSGDDSAKGGPHVVFVGASFGEILLIERFTDALKTRYPNLRVTWAIRERKTIEHVRQTRPNQPVVIWPFDFIVPVARFLDEVKPDVVVLAERFRFPTLVCGAARFGARLVLINGRGKNRRSPMHKLVLPYYRWICGAFTAMLMQTESHAADVRQFVGPNTIVETTGDVKTDVSRKELKPEVVASLESWLGLSDGTPILAAGSTDTAAEETFVLDAFARLRKQNPNARLLLAPRRPERRREVVSLVQDAGLTWSLRSEGDKTADVVILDTIGELSFAYRYAKSAYVGGFYDGMGHNVLEPVVWGVPAVYGSRRGHFAALQALCERFEVGVRVSDAAALAAHWQGVLDDPNYTEKATQRCEDLLAEQGGAFDKTLYSIERVINQSQMSGAMMTPVTPLSVP